MTWSEQHDMEILNSGSFVPLDNREKIDQLIYTARELASEVGRTEGFHNSGQTNHQLGLEMWKGAEYVCRAHEEANIRNLFLSKFLERLREIEKESSVRATPAQQPPVYSAPVQPDPASVPLQPQQPPAPPIPHAVAEQPSQDAAQDEYLGVIRPDDDIDNDRPSYADECVPEYDAEMEALVERLDNEGLDANVEPPPEVGITDVSVAETLTDTVITAESSSSSERTEKVELKAVESVESESIGPIILAEKEPYNFDGCTVTAVVQLLPETEGVRKCVVSVRTHDFTPRISIVDLSAADPVPQISATLGQAFQQYRNELPARVADKMKKEKPAAKKLSKTVSKPAKATASQTKPTAYAATATDVASANPKTGQSQAGLFT